MPLTTAYLALGSNLGDRLGHLRAALRGLEAGGDLLVVRTSGVYDNRAVGMGPADAFLNAAVEVKTCLSPHALLERCLEVEAELGRIRTGKWAPRPIDLDLLFYEDVVQHDVRLTLPHPRIAERDFVVYPLNELAPDLMIEGCTIRVLAAKLDRSAMIRIDEALWAEPPVRMIAAVADNRVIGKDGALPWSIPEDWEVFLKKTRGGNLVMGRLSFEEVRKDPDWRTDRRYWILTSQPEAVSAYGVEVATDIQVAIDAARKEGRPIWICGGEAVYAAAFPYSDELHLTRVHAEVEGDTEFPIWESTFNTKIASAASCDSGYNYTFETYTRS